VLVIAKNNASFLSLSVNISETKLNKDGNTNCRNTCSPKKARTPKCRLLKKNLHVAQSPQMQHPVAHPAKQKKKIAEPVAHNRKMVQLVVKNRGRNY
jgi:hypothetical protein